MTPPTPEQQVLFVRNVQRLLVEGQFTASYKFALLLAIADLCVLKGAHDPSASIRITERAYEQVEKSNGQVWISHAAFQHLGVEWRRLLVA